MVVVTSEAQAMNMFVLGFVVGNIATLCVGVFALALMTSAKRGDSDLFEPATRDSGFAPVRSPGLVLHSSPRGRALSSTERLESL